MGNQNISKYGRARIKAVFMAVFLLAFLLLPACGRRDALQNRPEQEETGTGAEEAENTLSESEEQRAAREQAEFVTDYTSAPLLETTPIKYLSMEAGATAEEVRFNWMSPGSEPGQVIWKAADTGRTEVYEAQCEASLSVEGYYINKAVVSDLRPGTGYLYKVGSDEGGWSPEYQYNVPEDKGDGFTFLAVSDAQIGQAWNEEMSVTIDTWDKVLTRLRNYVPEAQFMVHMGDQVADYGSAEQYDGFMNHLGLYGIPLVPVVGNHDVPNETTIEMLGQPTVPYFYEHFNVPNRSDVFGISEYDKDGCYYFVRGDALFIVLNSGTIQPIEAYETYIPAVIEFHPDIKWRVVIQHYPVYSSVEKYQQRLLGDQDCYARIMEDNDIDLFLTGHDHAYTRTKFVNGRKEPYEDCDYSSGATAVNPEGTMCVTCSTASGCLYHEIAPSQQAAFQGQPEVPMALKIDVTENELHLAAYLMDSWTIYDEYTIHKD